MSQQQEALRLADALCAESESSIKSVKYSTAKKSAAELRRLHAENEALKANATHKIVGYTTKPITWTSERHHSEQITKITQRAQSEHGFVHPVYAVCNAGGT